MSKSVPYLAVLLFAVLLICLSAHADTKWLACEVDDQLVYRFRKPE
jgi:hypothetical protein